MTTTTKLGDYLGRPLTNINPGNSAATDFLGRDVVSGNKDFNGRALTDTPLYPPAEWAASTAYTVGQRRRIPGTKEVQTLTAADTPAGNLKIDVTRKGSTLKTANIAIGSISAANIQAALVALANVEPGDVTVTGTGPYTLTWESELGNVTQVAADNAGLTDGTFAVATTTQGAVLEQVLECTVAGTSGSTKPTPPAIRATVVDGTVTWVRRK